jgi:hypothetical protein
MVWTSTIEELIVYWFSTVLVVVTASPSSTKPTRNVVPPMSVEMMLSWPSALASSWQPTIPPVRTEPMVLIALAGALAAVTQPPLPCMTSSEPVKPRARSESSKGARYARSRGPTWVFMIVVTLRAYSRMRGLTSLLSAT